ncbi:glycoside hydrolase family 3 C-terminal domain-containing protein [Streptomyces candidus]|uniref:Beta-glucosidase n=1 Tax=Streptomyces candidus TaxID=67283 RepID=A0A7X0LTE7_9ACTN|nr:glycoside hydrolase family 3 C-terminal domain-containing protein [Streptomyces candidus]MBB6438946.1 beta-glucosidase [Streptomyces candidus]
MTPDFRDPRLSDAERVEDLLARLTPGERVALLHQFAPAVAHEGVAAFRTGQEALHGVAWMGPATVFPQAVGLGATWNPELVRRVGRAVAAEIRAMHAKDGRVGLNVWAPTVNLLRNPLWGRGEEGYSEDPTLTTAIAVAYTRGLRGDHPHRWRTAPVLKHWLAHNNETNRATSSASVSPRVLHEYDLRAFRGAVEAGAVAGVMPAYNLVNGRPNHVSPYLREHLRIWTDQPLLVCSDAGAPSNLVDCEHYFDTHEEATAASLRAGVDSFTDHGTDSTVILARLQGALRRGLVDQEDIDAAARRHLHLRLALGEFDPEPERDGTGADDALRAGAFDTDEHRALALEAAEQAAVLLKNDGVLPLDPATVPRLRLAVVGPLADECKLDWYSGALLHRSTPLDGLRERFGAGQVTCAEGADRVRLRCADGLLRAPDSGDARGDGPLGAAGSLDPALLAGRTDLPPLTVTDDADDPNTVFTLSDWGNGVLTLRAADGRYLSVADDGFVRASAEQPGGWVVQETFRLVHRTGGSGTDVVGEGHVGGHLLRHLGTGGHVVVAADGVKVAVADEKPPGENGPPDPGTATGPAGEATGSDSDQHNDATGGRATGADAAPATGTVFTVETVEHGADEVARAASEADVVVVLLGNDPHINGRETEDRTTLGLPESQHRIWRAAHAANPRTVLVLVSSYPYSLPEAAAELPAVLWTAHGGQAAGTALARILAGDISPAGRLPQTWYASDGDLADLYDYDIIGSRQTYLYFDGAPLYPFGHGLSYTTFDYSDMTVERSQDADGPLRLRVAFTVTNTGATESDEVAQLYVRAAAPVTVRPLRELAGHRRLRLAPGDSRRLTFELPLSVLEFWSVAHHRWTLEPGVYEFLAGASCTDLRQSVPLRVEGTHEGPRPVLERGIEAVDYDECVATVILDRTRTRGDCVSPADPADDAASGELLYRDCDFGRLPVLDATLTVAGSGTVTLWAPGPGAVPVTVDVPPTAGPYDYTTLRTRVEAEGVRDLRVEMRGPLRLAHIDFSG